MIYFLLIILIAQFGIEVSAQPKTSVKISAIRIGTSLKIDGILEPEWNNAEISGIEYEIQPGDNTKAPVSTLVRIMYNNEFLYLSFDCKDDNPAAIRSNLTDRDRIFKDDFVGFILDTYNDGQSGYEFFTNPHGVQGDILRNGNNEDDSYDLIWHSAATMNSEGYIAEMAIPFKSLRFEDAEEQIWKIMLLRNYPRDDRYILSSSKIDRNDPYFTSQSSELIGIKGIKMPLTYEILPFFTGFQSGALNDQDVADSGFKQAPIRGRFGSSFKVNPTPSLTLEAVVNPDFSQVESDAQQISVNSTFSLFYQEKRPFFFEGSEIYKSPISSFYSRMINDPLVAIKASGKSGRISFAYLSAYDRMSPLIIPGEERSDFINTGKSSLGNILRARYNGTKNDYVGALFAMRNFEEAGSYFGGVDWNYLLFTNFYFSGQVVSSLVKEINDSTIFSDDRKFGSRNEDSGLNGEEYSGLGSTIRIERQARHHYMDLYIRDYSPAFVTPLGFQTRNNSRGIEFENGYSENYDSTFITKTYIFFRGGLDFNHSNIRKEKWLMLGGNLNFSGNSGLFIGYLPVNEELFGGVALRSVNRWFVNLNTTPYSWLSINLSSQFGKIIYRGDNPEVGTGHQFFLGVNLKPTDNLQTDFELERAGLRSQKTTELLYDGYILRNISSYQFSKQIFLRLITDYNSFSNDVSIFPLFSYKLNPFTIFYIGSTYNMHRYEAPHNYVENQRQYFLKFQYLFGNSAI